MSNIVETWTKYQISQLSRKGSRLAILLYFSALLLPTVAEACNIPVFRYALERWHPDPYRVVLFHRGPLGEAERGVVASLEAQMSLDRPPYLFRSVDVEGPASNEDKKLLNFLGDDTLPALLVQYPEEFGVDEPFWKAAFTTENLAKLLVSPVRQELVQRLLRGDSVVWLFLESGNQEEDNRVVALLESESRLLERGLKLPQLTDAPEDKLLTGPPLRLAFSVLRVPRATAELVFVEMLLGIRPEKSDKSDSYVFPVFGRGRALDALAAKKITPENIQEYAEFLVSACSCQVKEQNPGFDLLIGTNWDELFTTAEVERVSARHTENDAIAELVPIPRGNGSLSSVVDAAPTGMVTDAADEVLQYWPRLAILGFGAVGIASIWLGLRYYTKRIPGRVH